ncbi:DNA polymerase-3 subunit delta' [Salsuginibacillus halophilus]|uniref:DNA polymerase III subunit delta' n=1 Tax=Salsuginibacillus halophilus TaxID=517424 RepID=A0A2P8H7N5_9BACI|nr:DNA polymerase III subunit delta' [Salsuginibacillus halophilus]PSL42233.1 DNA polymerase-3 subunit delta' [Salsuginibacillus halophilus]
MNWNELLKRQPAAVRVLQGGLQKERLPHAYIFEGEAGVPKEAAARLLGQAFLCEERTTVHPCGECSDCRRVLSGSHPDLLTIEPEGASIKKGQVEMLQKEFTYKGMESAKKVYLIHEAHRMTASAGNSLLKFLEEPEGETLAILLTENLHFLLDTIVSRAQVVTFAPLPEDERAEELKEQGYTNGQAALLARIADRATVEAQEEPGAWIVQAKTVVVQLTEEVQKRPQQVLLTLQEKWLPHFQDRKEQQIGLDLLLYWYRDVLYTKLKRLSLAYPDEVERLHEEALHTSEEKVSRQLEAILDAKRQLAANVNSQLLMERLLLRLQEGF